MLPITKLHEFLVQWAYDFFKHKDIITRSIEHIEKNKEGCDVFIQYKDREQCCWIKPFLENVEELLSQLSKEKYHCLVVFNTKENFLLLKKIWKQFVSFSRLKIFFVNPFSQLEKKWIIYPATHDRISDEDSLITGLDALFEGVEPITKEALERNI